MATGFCADGEQARPRPSTDGVEWIVDAHGCSADRLSDLGAVQALFARVIEDLGLRTIGDAIWHQFPPPGGITGLCLLAESHLAVHTFPEFASLCLNLFCCVPRREWDFGAACKQLFAAESVTVRRMRRCYVAEDSSPVRTGMDAVGSRAE